MAALYVIVGLLVVLHLVAQWLLFYGESVLDRSFQAVDLLDLDVEVSIPTWWQQLVLAAAAGLAFVVGWVNRRHRPGVARRWTGLAVILVLLSIDEGASIHERLVEPLRDALDIDGGIFWFAWVIPALIATVIFGLLYLRFWWRLPSEPRRTFAIAAGLFLLGAIGMEMVTGIYTSEGSIDFGYGVLNAFEEGLEMLGAVVLISGLLSMIDIELGGRRLPVSVAVEDVGRA